MKIRYLETVLSVIAVLLCVVVVQLMALDRAGRPFRLVEPAYAQTQGMTADVLIFPVGNQDVRKWVLFDRRNNVLYKYDGGGGLEESWDVTVPGEKFQKRR